MDRALIKCFWSCGDNEIIEFALQRARLNSKEKEVVFLILDQCMTQEEAAEKMYLSTRKVQELWASAVDKLLQIPWVRAYARELERM